MNGWIKIYRDIQKHWVWENPEYLRAWLDILMMVNHREAKVLMDASLVTVPAGSVITSEVKLAARWGWGRTKLRNFLKLLESDGMITKNTNKKQTTINVVNWAKFQNEETTDEQQTNNWQTSDEQQTNTNKNDKECIKNEKKNKAFQKPTVDEVRDYIREQGYHVSAEQFVNWYEANGWMVGRNKMKSWQAAVRNWEQREKKDKKTAFNTFDQRTYDYVDLTERLAAKG